MEEEMTKEEMQRYLIQQAKAGKSEAEAFRNFIELLGLEYPIEDKEDEE